MIYYLVEGKLKNIFNGKHVISYEVAVIATYWHGISIQTMLKNHEQVRIE